MYSTRKSLFSLASAAVLILLAACAHAQTTYYVDDWIFASDTLNDGLSAATPFRTIQHAIGQASDGDTVLVASGTYYEHNIDFQGKDITVQSEYIFSTTLDCEGLGRAFLFTGGETRAARLSGFFIRNCQADDSWPLTLDGPVLEGLFGGSVSVPAGGAIRIVDSSPTITDCLIFGAVAFDYGSELGVGGGIAVSGMAVSGGGPRVVNCVFFGCAAVLGGGIYAEESDLTVINTLLGGIEGQFGGFIGPGVVADGGSLNLINDTLIQIFAISEPDVSPDPLASTVVSLQGAAVLVGNSILWDNDTPANLYVADEASSITVKNSDVEGSRDSDGAWNLPGVTDGGGNIDADPLLDGGFLNPVPESPCFDTGDDAVYNAYASDITTGIEGIPRFNGAHIDMGWLEFFESDTTAPVITTPGNLTATATSTAGAVVSFTVTATDDVDGSVPVTCTPASGSQFPLGTTTVNCSATDAAGNTATASFTVTVTYAWSGVLQPINTDGTISVFKAGSTVPVRFALTGASANITNAVARFSATMTGSGTGTVNETGSTAAGDSGALFRYDAASRQYIYNWSTKGKTAGTYELRIDLDDGLLRTVTIRLR